MSFQFICENWSFDPGLQIVHADVRLEANGEVVIEEPLCVDVGMPALLLSGLQNTDSHRWASPEEWQRMPFFCCGCGDPECRAFSFRVRHSGDTVVLTELEERPNREPRVVSEYDIRADEYRSQVLAVGKQFLAFVRQWDYRPYYADTVKVAEELVGKLEQAANR